MLVGASSIRGFSHFLSAHGYLLAGNIARERSSRTAGKAKDQRVSNSRLITFPPSKRRTKFVMRAPSGGIHRLTVTRTKHIRQLLGLSMVFVKIIVRQNRAQMRFYKNVLRHFAINCHYSI